MLVLMIFQFAVIYYLLWSLHRCYHELDKASKRADIWELKCHALRQKAGPSSFEQGVAAAKKIKAVIKQQIALCDGRLVVEGKCGGHHYLVRFRSEDAADAMLSIQRWYDMPELGLCQQCVESMQDGILREAGITG